MLSHLPLKVFGLAFAVAGVVVASSHTNSAVKSPRNQERPECPHDSVLTVRGAERSTVVYTEVSLSNFRTIVPEFHDCQRLLLADSSYGVLAAIYASARLDSALFDLARQNPDPHSSPPCDCKIPLDPAYTHREPPRSSGTRGNPLTDPAPAPLSKSTWAVAIGTIVAFDGTYAPLGILTPFSCVYFAGSAATGYAVWIARNGSPRCVATLRISELATATRLEVQSYTVSGMLDEDYPPTARWDWDSVHAQQYIGFKCGAAWCEAGVSGFEPSRRWRAPAGMTSRLQRRVFEIKGWYDEQLLSVPGDFGPRPSSILGTVFPDPGLDTLTKRDFDNPRPAALVMLNKDSANIYKRKLNFVRTHSDGSRVKELNVIYVLARTDPMWSNRVMDRTGRNDKSRREHFRDHSADIARGNFVIPGSARWRWKLEDETVWKGCDAGCCETLN